MRGLVPERVDELLLLGAHCDDIAIGAGGSLLGLCRAHPGVRVTAVVFTGAGTPREAEERGALGALCPGADLRVAVLDLPDSQLPDHWRRVKEVLRELAEATRPDLILAPSPHDAHQDHRLVAELVPTAFRDHLTLGYEILKWESDLTPRRSTCRWTRSRSGKRRTSCWPTTPRSASIPGSTVRRSPAWPGSAVCSAAPAMPRPSTCASW